MTNTAPGDVIAVIGIGGVGFMALEFAKALARKYL